MFFRIMITSLGLGVVGGIICVDFFFFLEGGFLCVFLLLIFRVFLSWFLWTRPVGRVHFCCIGSVLDGSMGWLVLAMLCLFFRVLGVFWSGGVGKRLTGGVVNI